jgi:DNA-binding beta-propeller fold protein YncE
MPAAPGPLPSADERARVVLNGSAFEVEREWGASLADLPPGRVSQVAVDSTGRIHVLRRSRSLVAVVGPEGQFLFSYGAAEIFDGHGISVDHLDRIWVADRDAHQIMCFSVEGELLSSLGRRHQPRWRAPFNHPTKVAVAPDGEIYVADGYGNAQVHRFSASGDHIGSIGEVGHQPGAFMTPHALIIDRQDRVLVCDRENDRVQVFDRAGRWLTEWRGLFRPMDLAERPDGTILVTDQVPSVTCFAPSGERLGRCRPSLNGAHGIAVDTGGNLYLAETSPAFLTRLRLCPEFVARAAPASAA